MSAIQFVNADPKEVEKELITLYEAAYGETLYPGDERRIFLLQLVPVITGLKASINDAACQNLLRYARGAVLDELGGTKTPRLPAQKASVTLRFTLSGAQPQAVTVPANTRATPDGLLYFSTMSDLVIQPGQTSGDIKAYAVEAGEKYNGYAAGQIKNLVDPVPFVASVINTDTSSWGADTEDDERYRERIRQAPGSYSTAGPEGAYIYWAKTADANIADVTITSPSPCVVKITVLMEGGQIPTQAVLDTVLETMNDRKRRPMTDLVEVQAPEEVLYNIDLTYYISTERSTEETAIRNLIEDSCITQYTAWQCEKLGRAINPDYLRQLVLNAGAFRVDITNPAYSTINGSQVAKNGTITINYGGLI